jgi:hypothetical protein
MLRNLLNINKAELFTGGIGAILGMIIGEVIENLLEGRLCF